MVKKVQDGKPTVRLATTLNRLPPSSGRTRGRVTIGSVAAVVKGRSDRDQTFANLIARMIRDMEEQFPLLTFMDAWRDRRVDCEAWFVLAVLRGYRMLIERDGPKPGDQAL